MGAWKGPDNKGEWYEGVVKSINDDKETAHVHYDDGDSDEDLKWSDIRFLD